MAATATQFYTFYTLCQPLIVQAVTKSDHIVTIVTKRDQVLRISAAF